MGGTIKANKRATFGDGNVPYLGYYQCQYLILQDVTIVETEKRYMGSLCIMSCITTVHESTVVSKLKVSLKNAYRHRDILHSSGVI